MRECVVGGRVAVWDYAEDCCEEEEVRGVMSLRGLHLRDGWKDGLREDAWGRALKVYIMGREARFVSLRLGSLHVVRILVSCDE